VIRARRRILSTNTKPSRKTIFICILDYQRMRCGVAQLGKAPGTEIGTKRRKQQLKMDKNSLQFNKLTIEIIAIKSVACHAPKGQVIGFEFQSGSHCGVRPLVRWACGCHENLGKVLCGGRLMRLAMTKPDFAIARCADGDRSSPAGGRQGMRSCLTELAVRALRGWRRPFRGPRIRGAAFEGPSGLGSRAPSARNLCSDGYYSRRALHRPWSKE